MDVEAWMTNHPTLDRGSLVGSVVVHHQMHVELGRNVGFDGVEEFTKLQRAVTPLQLTDDLAGPGIERGEEAGGSVAEIVVGAAFGLAGAHRQQRRGTFERLNLTLLVHAQHQGAVGWIEVKANDSRTLSIKSGSWLSLNSLAVRL